MNWNETKFFTGIAVGSLVVYAAVMVLIAFSAGIVTSMLLDTFLALVAACLVLGTAVGLACNAGAPVPWIFFLPAAAWLTRPLLIAKGTKVIEVPNYGELSRQVAFYAAPWVFWLSFLVLLAAAIGWYWRSFREWRGY